jgi:integrase
MKSRTGYVYKDKKTGSWYARVTYTDNAGKRRDIKRRVEKKSQGNKLLKTLVHDFENGGRTAIDAERITFNDLADYYSEHYLLPAQYVSGRKVAGLRSVVTVRGYINVFREYFGRQRVKTITYDDLRQFKLQRLKTPTHQSEQRSITTVNRELAYLRRLLNIAEQNTWIRRNPFKTGDALIHVSDEMKRERILSHDEETRLLALCIGRRAHLRPMIIAALDTGCRLGELMKMKWLDVDQNGRVITIQAFNTKTMKERQVSITSRLAIELETLWDSSIKDQNALVFGIKSAIRQAFKGVCCDAGIHGLRAHDLRHSHASRLDDLGFSLSKIGAQLGHSQVQTTSRYVNRDKTGVRQVAVALDGFNSQLHQAAEVSTAVN